MASDDYDANAAPPDTSVSGLVTTLVPTFIIAAVYIVIFLILRKSHRRFYAPRTYLGTLREQERTPDVPNGLFNWFGAFWRIPDTYALQHQSLDSYLFLRFLRIIVTIAFVGCCITWPILFPINAVGRAGESGLNTISYSNIDTTTSRGKNLLFAHVFVGWLYFGFILFMVCRETIFYINLRQAFLLSSIYANRISSRTVLFTSVPSPYLDEAKLRKVFGDGVKNIWIQCDTTKVDELVEKRDKIAFKLESAETKLIKLANAERIKALKSGGNQDEASPITSADTESGSIAARWIPQKKRPTHKIGKFGLVGAKVDSINWCREQLLKLIPETDAAQQAYKDGADKKVNAVFIEFYSQSEAQGAYQTLSHHQALHMSPRYIGVQPGEVVWKSLSISWWQKVIRRYAVLAFITVLIIFWAIPVAFIGVISNVQQLSVTVSWLFWLQKVPEKITGLISGLLPSVLLAVLMSLVPIIMRICAKLAGEPSLARVELFTQNAYFAFQVIQVFLVVTVGSSATAVAAQLIGNPTGILGLLSSSLPKASNFYISYFILQGLTISAGVISQVSGFVIFRLLYKYLSSTPRSLYTKWTNLSALSWGSILPVYANIMVIAITYGMIAPLVLGFAAIGLAFFYIAYRYNVLFVTDTKIDTKGLIYPRALQHLLTGVYLGEICLLGLFIVSTSIGPIVLMVIFLVFTVLFHISMNSALDPLLGNLPRSLEAEEESIANDLEVGNGNSNKLEGAHSGPSTEEKSTTVIPSSPHKEPNFLTKFLKPHIYSDYATLRALVPHTFVDSSSLYTPEIEANAYYPPSVASATPLLWIPRDIAGVSAQEVAHTSKVIPITDEGASFDEKNKLVWDADATDGTRPPIWEEKTYY